MLRSMYSGISGMKVNQLKMDVIGNNISNVGTTSFKGSRVTFSDMLSQTQSSAMSPSQKTGGTNAKQIGLGVQLSSIDRVMTQGMMQPTGRALDVAVDGDGFFMVSKGPAIAGDGVIEVSHNGGYHGMTEQSLANSGSEIMYSRDGAFILDEQGNLLTGDGFRVLGYSLTNDDNGIDPTSKSPSIDKSTGSGYNTNFDKFGLTFDFGPGSQLNGYKINIGNIGPGTVTSADINTSSKEIVIHGDFATSGALTVKQIESAINKALSSKGISQQVSVGGKPTEVTGFDSNFTNGKIGNATSTPPVTAVVPKVVFGTGGLTINFTSSATPVDSIYEQLNAYKFEIGSTAVGTKTDVAIDEKNKVITINFDMLNTAAAGEISAAMNNALSGVGIELKAAPTYTNGFQLKTTPAATTISASCLSSGSGIVGGTSVQSLDAYGEVNFIDGTGEVKAYDGNLKTLRIPDKVKIAGTDTYLRVKTYSIDKNGIINGVLEDGRVAALGQIAMASFKNPEGLTSLGGNTYGMSANSGEAVVKSGIGTLGEDNSKGYGDNLQGMLEMSNVDLAEQFTDMIVTSKAFQAAGKMITTGDEMLQDIINLKR